MPGITQTIQNTTTAAKTGAKAATPVSSIPGVAPHVPTPPMSQPGVAYSPINPASDLRSQTIGVGPTADRNTIAQNQINTWNASSAPQFQADLRDATSHAAGAGQLGSGQLRTSLGNLAYNRDLQRNSAQSNYLNAAQTGSIEDAYRNVGIAQQQQGRQDQAQNQSFNQAATTLQLGNQGNPSPEYQNLSNLYGAGAQGGFQGITNTRAGIGSDQNSAGIIDALRKAGLLPGAATEAPASPSGLPAPNPIFSDYPMYGGATG